MAKNTKIIEIFDPGLQSYMVKVYNYMGLALVITGVASIVTITFQPLVNLLFILDSNHQLLGITGLGIFIIFSPLIISIYFFFSFKDINIMQAQWLFWAYAWLMGMSLSQMCFIYTRESITYTLFISASIFGIMSLYGYTTKRSLASFGSFMVMGLMGILLVSLMNLFFRSSIVYFITSLLGVFIFIGLTVWDTQKIKMIYYQTRAEDQQKIAILGALALYLDLINLFLHLLTFLGRSKKQKDRL